MASLSTTNNDIAPLHFLSLPLEIQHCIYRFVVPYTIRPRKSPSEIVFEAKAEQKPSIALFLVNKQFYEGISYVLYRHSHFLVSINPGGVTCAALESPILWDLDQTERMSLQLASNIRHIDIDLEWVQRWKFSSASVMNMRLVPLLEYICEHLRAFRVLQTLTVRWNKCGIFKSRPRIQLADFILGPLEQLQTDIPRLQIAVQATQQESNSEIGDNPNDSEVYVKLHDYMSELRETQEHPSMGEK